MKSIQQMVVFLCLTSGLIPTTPLFGQSNTQVVENIKGQWKSFISAWEKEDAPACANFYTDDGMNIPSDSPNNIGKESIGKFYEFLFSLNQSSKYEHHIDHIDVYDDIAVEIGHFNVDWVRNDGTEWTFRARSMAHWVWDQSGEWKLKKFLFNRPPDAGQ